MTLRQLFQSKSHLVIFLVGLVGVFILFVTLTTTDITQQNTPLTQNDKSEIEKSVASQLSDTFSQDELRFTNFAGDHEWAIALVYTTNENVEAGFVLMKNNGAEWNVMYGPATDYYKEDLTALGAPEELIDQIDSVFIPNSGEEQP